MREEVVMMNSMVSIGERKDAEVSLRPIDPIILDTESYSLALLYTTLLIESHSANESSH